MPAPHSGNHRDRASLPARLPLPWRPLDDLLVACQLNALRTFGAVHFGVAGATVEGSQADAGYIAPQAPALTCLLDAMRALPADAATSAVKNSAARAIFTSACAERSASSAARTSAGATARGQQLGRRRHERCSLREWVLSRQQRRRWLGVLQQPQYVDIPARVTRQRLHQRPTYAGAAPKRKDCK